MDKRTLNPLIGLLFLCLLTSLPGCPGLQQRPRPLDDAARLLAYRPPYVKTCFAETPDGWKLALHRYAPEKVDPSRMPVILCHGLGYNSRFWDLVPANNLAEFLRDRGWDTWLLDLRGVGASTKPFWYWLRGPDLSVFGNPDVEFTQLEWNIEDLILEDVPTAVDFVRKETGAASVAWVGHSLGGIIGMGHIERNPQDSGIGCLVGAATPMIVPQPATVFQRDIKHLRFVLTAMNNRWQSMAQALTLGQLKTPVDEFYHNEKNMDHVTLQMVRMRVAEDVPAPVLDQLLAMAETGDLTSPDGRFNYSKELSRLTLPALFIAGKVDHSADPEAIHYAYERVASKDKTFRLFGLAWGDSIDYGHDDLILGKRAKEEVFPVIENWLRKKGSGAMPLR
jgi:pimeloyl-ACP methyl ester carboxylesterase